MFLNNSSFSNKCFFFQDQSDEAHSDEAAIGDQYGVVLFPLGRHRKLHGSNLKQFQKSKQNVQLHVSFLYLFHKKI